MPGPTFPLAASTMTAVPMVLVDHLSGEPYTAGGGGSIVATVVNDGAVTLAAATPQDVIATATSANGRAIKNRGPNDATYVVGATAAGASTERTLLAGEEKVFPYTTTLRVSVFSTLGTTIEWETWQ